MRRVLHTGFNVFNRDVPAFKQEVAAHSLRIRKEVPLGTLAPDRTTFYFKVPPDRRQDLEALRARFSVLRDHPDPTLRRLLVREECEFTPTEINEATLLQVSVARAPAGGTEHRRSYTLDFSRSETDDRPIPWCWVESNLQFAARDLPTATAGIVEAWSGFVLVTDAVLAAVPGFHTPNAKLEPVINRTTGQPLPWRHLYCRRRLPPLHPATTGLLIGEPSGPGGLREHFGNMHEGYWPALDRAALDRAFPQLPDITFTHELFGCWHATGSTWEGLPTPRLVVSQRVYRELRAAKVTRLQLTPVRMMD